MLSRRLLRPALRPIRPIRPQNNRQISDFALSLISDPPLPIYVLIPLTTFAVRATLTLPFAIYSRRNTIKLSALNPLISGWTHHYMRKHAKLGLPPKEWEKLVTKDANAKKKEIVARHKVQFWRSIASTAAGVPVWIGMSYFVRSLAGDMEGIMALQGKGFGWIVDLGIPDTTGITGIAFASLMLMNTEYNARQVDTAVGEEKGRTSRIISNILRVMAVLAVPISMGNPAILPLYWVSSASFTLGQNVLLDKLMPLPPSFWKVKPRASVNMGRTKLLALGRRMQEASTGIKKL